MLKSIIFKSLIVFSILISTLFSCKTLSKKENLKKPTTKPNILFIMSDDHAYQAISAYSDKLIKTPNIDRIAKEGMLFSNACVTNSICAPSRATILTGKHTHSNGKIDNIMPFDTTQITDMVLDTMPVGWLDGIVDTAVDGTFDYLLTGNAETAVVSIDLNPMLNQLQGEPGRQLVLRYLETLPACTPLQLLGLLGGQIPTCVPVGISLDQLSRQVHGAVMPMLISQVSVGQGGIVTIPLATIFSSSPDMVETVQRIQFFYRLAPQVWVLWLPRLACLLLILLFAVRSLW